MYFPIKPLVAAKLLQLTKTMQGQPEAVPDVLWDTELYTSATTTISTFFSTPRSDLTLSNLQGNGQIPSQNYFRMFYAGLDVIQDAFLSANVDTGVWDDYQKLLFVGRSVHTFTLNGKPYLQIPASFLHTSGGVIGSGVGTLTAPASVQVGNNSLPDGGFPIDGSITIAPLVGFQSTIQWAAAQTLAAGNPRLRLWYAGVRYRPVV